MDNQWRGTWKQRLGVVASPWYVRRLHYAAFLPGERQACFARPLRFPDDRIWPLFVGQIGQGKGIGYLLDAWALAERLGMSRNAQLDLVGPFVGDADPVLALGGLIHHVPAVPRPALPSIYRSGSVLSLPSLIEGMRLVVLEAMACPPGGWEKRPPRLRVRES